jgi:hypothetical protein
VDEPLRGAGCGTAKTGTTSRLLLTGVLGNEGTGPVVIVITVRRPVSAFEGDILSDKPAEADPTVCVVVAAVI